MSFEPVSNIKYRIVDADRQLLVCTFDAPHDSTTVLAKWHDQAAATFPFREGDDLCDVIRDILANPQIRGLAFDGPGSDAGAADVFRKFWNRETKADWGLREDHLELVRQFVDLFDEECGLRKPLQPFWPERLRYVEGSWKR